LADFKVECEIHTGRFCKRSLQAKQIPLLFQFSHSRLNISNVCDESGSGLRIGGYATIQWKNNAKLLQNKRVNTIKDVLFHEVNKVI
jgi:hypothetical protein